MSQDGGRSKPAVRAGGSSGEGASHLLSDYRAGSSEPNSDVMEKEQMTGYDTNGTFDFSIYLFILCVCAWCGCRADATPPSINRRSLTRSLVSAPSALGNKCRMCMPFVVC